MNASLSTRYGLAMFDELFRLAAIVAGFGIVSLAADDIGRWFRRLNLPLISGFLACGIFVGPFALGLIERDAIGYLGFIDEVSIAFIAFAAGAELYLKVINQSVVVDGNKSEHGHLF